MRAASRAAVATSRPPGSRSPASASGLGGQGARPYGTGRGRQGDARTLPGPASPLSGPFPVPPPGPPHAALGGPEPGLPWDSAPASWRARGWAHGWSHGFRGRSLALLSGSCSREGRRSRSGESGGGGLGLGERRAPLCPYLGIRDPVDVVVPEPMSVCLCVSRGCVGMLGCCFVGSELAEEAARDSILPTQGGVGQVDARPVCYCLRWSQALLSTKVPEEPPRSSVAQCTHPTRGSGHQPVFRSTWPQHWIADLALLWAHGWQTSGPSWTQEHPPGEPG